MVTDDWLKPLVDPSRDICIRQGGKFCVHPSQIEIVNRAFQPQSEELQAARKLVSDFERASRSGRGANSIRGVMVDDAGLKRARRLLERQPPEQH